MNNNNKKREIILNIIYTLSFILIIYCTYNLNLLQIENKERINIVDGRLAAIMNKLNIAEKDRILFSKLEKNQEVWKGTPCIECHITTKTALPIYKRTAEQALNIIRNGSLNTESKGMPVYKYINNKDLSDLQLLQKLNELYTTENLQYAKDLTWINLPKDKKEGEGEGEGEGEVKIMDIFK